MRRRKRNQPKDYQSISDQPNIGIILRIFGNIRLCYRAARLANKHVARIITE